MPDIYFYLFVYLFIYLFIYLCTSKHKGTMYVVFQVRVKNIEFEIFADYCRGNSTLSYPVYRTFLATPVCPRSIDLNEIRENGLSCRLKIFSSKSELGS